MDAGQKKLIDDSSVVINHMLYIYMYPTSFSYLLQTAEEGASTSIYAAVSPELEGVGGTYLYNEQRTKSVDVSYDEELQRKLWTESCKMVGISDISRCL